MTDNDIGYLQHGTGGCMRTESVAIKERGYPYTGQWLAFYEGKWRVVKANAKRTWITVQGESITIQIWGV